MTRGWQRLAACRGEDPRLFAATDPRAVREARTVCAGCPVMLTCRTAAHAAAEPAGIWGGEPEQERAAWARALSGLTACGDKPGTTTGWDRHYRAGQEPCPECRAAQKLENADRSGKSTREQPGRMRWAAAEDIAARRAQVRTLVLEHDMTDAAIAAHLDVTERTVLRDRKAAGIPPARPEHRNRRSA